MGTLRDRELADDLLQDVFCRAWQSRHRNRDLHSQRAYLWTIADRLARDHMRRRRRKVSVNLLDESQWDKIEPKDTESMPVEVLERLEVKEQLEEALTALSKSQRRTLLLRYYGSLSFTEVAKIMDRPLNTVLSHCRRGLKTLRRLLVEKSS